MKKYGEVTEGIFCERKNRFIAEVLINGEKEPVHIKNTGRLRELLIPGAKVILEISDNPDRKTKYSLIAVYAYGHIVNIDSQAPNLAAFHALEKGKINEIGTVNKVRREVTFKNSRFDLYYEKEKEKGFVEVKGVTLVKERTAMFPDAPTSRGTKHVMELIKAQEEGYHASILFLIQMEDCKLLCLNWEMDPVFSEAVVEAVQKGVNVFAYDCKVSEKELVLNQPVPVSLEYNCG